MSGTGSPSAPAPPPPSPPTPSPTWPLDLLGGALGPSPEFRFQWTSLLVNSILGSFDITDSTGATVATAGNSGMGLHMASWEWTIRSADGRPVLRLRWPPHPPLVSRSRGMELLDPSGQVLVAELSPKGPGGYDLRVPGLSPLTTASPGPIVDGFSVVTGSRTVAAVFLPYLYSPQEVPTTFLVVDFERGWNDLAGRAATIALLVSICIRIGLPIPG